MTESPVLPETAEVPPPSLLQVTVAETVGTAVLVLLGCGAAVFSGAEYVGTAFAFGLAVLVMAYSFGRISGGHFNPAITLGAAIGGRIAWRETPVYFASQIVGGIIGAFLLFILAHGFEAFDATGNMGQNSFGEEGSGYAWWAALFLELVLTAIFVTVVLAVTDARNEHPGLGPLAIGLALAAVHLVAVPVTGTSVNPARSIGPALFAGGDAILQLWVFILGPAVGGLLAGLAYAAVYGHAKAPVPGSGFSLPTRAAAPGVAQDQYQRQWNQEQQGGQGQWAGQGQGQWGDQSAQSASPSGQGAGAHTQWGQEPIIQDGWQWDPQAQQWIPAQQPYPGQQQGQQQYGQQQGQHQSHQYGQPQPGGQQPGGQYGGQQPGGQQYGEPQGQQPYGQNAPEQPQQPGPDDRGDDGDEGDYRTQIRP